MGAFKGLENHDTGAVLRTDTMRPLYEPFDPEQNGGLLVAANGQVHEVRHPDWHTGDSSVAGRTNALPFHVVDGRHDRLQWEGNPFNASRPTLGVENEIAVMHGGAWHTVSKDGRTLEYPDGRQELLADHGFDPEALKVMVEYSTNEVAHGYEELRRNSVQTAAAVERWLEVNALTTPQLSLFPEAFDHAAISELPYVQKVTDRMPQMAEFGTMSSQLHVQVMSMPNAQHAMNNYQAVQAVTSLLSSAAPIRDGSFETTIGDHYQFGTLPERGPKDLATPTLPQGDFASLHKDLVPYDWREPARVVGSPSAGTLPEVTPVDTQAALRRADSLLRDGSVVSAGRAFGWHADRLRVDIGTIEVCNLGTAGGNLHKSNAVQELTAKYLVAEQLRYASMTEAERADAKSTYQQGTETGHINNIQVGLWGKQAQLTSRDGRQVTPQEMFDEIVAFVDNNSPEPLSKTARAELNATLATEPLTYQTPEETFEAFFKPNSPMTATDALRHAHKVDPDMPLNDLLTLFSYFRREHVYDLAHELEATSASLGSLALTK